MKYQTKLALQIFFIGLVILALGMVISNFYNSQSIINHEFMHTTTLVDEVASSIEHRLLEKIKTNKTLSISPIIKEALIASNNKLDLLTKEVRDAKIEGNNEKWKSLKDINDPFILKYTNNRVAQFLKEQQNNLKGEYGEIFITNKYGAIIAATAKLTTLAHSQKYWWKGAYNNGQGVVFIDDRGFDASVDGYVLGIVIPIWDNGEIIGIIKANLNILGAISEMILTRENEDVGSLKLIRSGGEIVFEKGIVPLSSRVPDKLLGILQTNPKSFLYSEADKNWMIGMSDIGITIKGAKGFVFGGSFESKDHVKGNSGESWSIVEFRNLQQITAHAGIPTISGSFIGLLLVIILAVSAFFLGKLAIRPLEQLISISKKVAKADFSQKIIVSRNDEIGLLGKAFNKMTSELKENTTSIELLELEIDLRLKAEDEIKLQGRRFQIIMETSPFGIIIIGDNNKLEYVNPVIEKLFGTVNDNKCYEYLHCINNPCEEKDCCTKEIMAGKSVRRERSIIVNNQKMRFAIYGTPFLGQDGAMSRFEIFQDITVRAANEKKIKNQNLELTKLNATKDLFFSIIAHDLKSPFTSLLGFSKLLYEGFDNYNDIEKYKYINIIHGGINNTYKLLENLLLWSLSQRGTIEFHPEKYNIYLLITESLELIKPSSDVKNISIIKQLDESIDTIVDKNMFLTVFRNLVSNAIKFTPIGGIIDIETNEVEDDNNKFIQVSVSDSGVGIPEESLSKLFSLDKSISTLGTNNEKGTGLGLILCKEFVDRHGGKIWVESKLNVGSKFCFTVPI